MRKSNIFALFLTGCLLLLAASLIDGVARRHFAAGALADRAALAHSLTLTDLCLFTEARYTRHPTQADRHAPFQDHPAMLDYFPSGSLAPPP
uniref:Uncharacterized protein n=1 Tax=Candidatus Kentrum sp. DK TaxID=2126562 RepID=A0A450THY6_9GAMM|nr:MAG: hypothetical protein BECKDK2373C_GA0170839_101853 [Candidatus Kentron sp. DK]VFJ66875.1 MAG: hypothetical protein BECKDK2373B_GA0170837_11795 [Candidatus Kentron sp. DK]